MEQFSLNKIEKREINEEKNIYLDKDLYQEMAYEYNELPQKDVQKEKKLFQEIIEKHNVRSMSVRQLQKMTNDLYLAGIISAKEAIDMTEPLDYSKSCDSDMNIQLEKNIDFIKAWEDKVKWEKENNPDPKQIKQKIKVLSIFKKIESIQKKILFLEPYLNKLTETLNFFMRNSKKNK